MTRDKWFGKEMDYIQAKDLTDQLMRLCEGREVQTHDLILESEREDYAEAIRAVLEHLP